MAVLMVQQTRVLQIEVTSINSCTQLRIMCFVVMYNYYVNNYMLLFYLQDVCDTMLDMLYILQYLHKIIAMGQLQSSSHVLIDTVAQPTGSPPPSPPTLVGAYLFILFAALGLRPGTNPFFATLIYSLQFKGKYELIN